MPNLMAAYDHGRLVPFLGGGASVGGCTLWPEFVAKLEGSPGIWDACKKCGSVKTILKEKFLC